MIQKGKKAVNSNFENIDQRYCQLPLLLVVDLPLLLLTFHYFIKREK